MDCGQKMQMDLHSGAKIILFLLDVNRFLDQSSKLRIK
jgi:hypothetical protein